jgi:HlyD family secretion protein
VGETTCVVDNKDFKLLPNINVGVTIVTAKHSDALTVPREAIRQDNGKSYVFQVVNDELQRHEVATSIFNLTEVEVTNGVSEHAVLALNSINSKPLHNGLAVKVVH